ncbi:uncharacterized protein OCT59_030083 [Rhizophagus irregularis]|uniref:uncharacterized protein n=1 Tax=Rhizophagus irregularis TaxID=588596 RepID=UPI00332F8BBE|nr:hypothetical protein OCT59_030083 [Rhizophagus irregularis]
MDILQDNNIFNIATTTSAASAASTLALFSLSTQSSSTPSSPSSFTHEYDTSNYFSRLPNETIFNILAFVITNQNTVKSPTTVYSPHKQLSILSQVNRLFYKIANDALLWQITFEAKFDSEAIIRAGITDNNLIGDSVSVFNGTESEGEGESISSQVQNSSSFVKLQTGRNVWKELYKERQISLNKIKNYVKPPLPSPFVSSSDDDGETDDFSTIVHLDDFMELHFDDENEINNDSDNNTNNVDSSTLDSTDQVDDIVDDQLFDFDVEFNFIGNEKDGARTEEMERDNIDFTFEDGEELENSTLVDMTFTAIKDDDVKEDIVEEGSIKEDTMKENTVKENTVKEDTVKEDTVKEDTVKEGTIKEDIVKEDIVKEDIENVDIENVDIVNIDIVSENIFKEDTKDEELLRENVTKFEDNFGMDNPSVINVNGVSQDLDFVSEDLIKFDDPEFDSIFASDAIESDNFIIDTQASNAMENIENIDNDIQHNEVLVKDTNNSAKEVDHVAQAQDFSNPEINGDLNVTLQDYDESSKLLDDDEESFKLPDDEESSSKLHEGIPQIQNYGESSTIFQKPQEISSSKLSDNVYTESIDDDLPDFDENEESQDYEDNQNITNLIDYDEGLSQLQDFDGNGASINLQDFNVTQVESSSKEIINEQEIDLPDYEEDDGGDEITNLPNYDIKTNLQNETTVNDELNYVDEEVGLFDVNITEINIENAIENNIEQQNGLPNGDAIIENENDESPDHEINNDESNLPNHDENDDIMIPQDHESEIEEMDDMFDNYDNDNEVFDLFVNDNILNRIRTRRKIQQNNDPELLKILNIIWKICQENDGMNSEVLLGANVKELAVSLIKSLDKMEDQIQCLSIALQILSILISWHPELTIDLNKNKSLWRTIHYAMINVDMFFPELENTGYKQLILPASAGSAIHIFFHTNFFNLSNPSEFFDEYVPPPQLIPDSNVFNNVYNKSELGPEETIIQPFGEDFSGKWCGYYLYYISNQPSPMRESAMDITSLEFSPSEPGKVYYLNHIDYNPVRVTDKVVKEFSGSGSDKHGEFVIKHGIITEKGNVNFVKTYKGKHSWIYDGILLPVGICGRWGNSSQWHGNFWIWKR